MFFHLPLRLRLGRRPTFDGLSVTYCTCSQAFSSPSIIPLFIMTASDPSASDGPLHSTEIRGGHKKERHAEGGRCLPAPARLIGREVVGRSRSGLRWRGDLRPNDGPAFRTGAPSANLHVPQVRENAARERESIDSYTVQGGKRLDDGGGP